MLHYVHSSLIYSSQNLETTQMSINIRMDTENVVHIHNGVIKIYDFMKFTGKWMELENTILSEETQMEKNTPPLLGVLKVGTTTLEISLEVPQKIGHSTAGGSSNTSPGHISRRCPNR